MGCLLLYLVPDFISVKFPGTFMFNILKQYRKDYSEQLRSPQLHSLLSLLWNVSVTAIWILIIN